MALAFHFSVLKKYQDTSLACTYCFCILLFGHKDSFDMRILLKMRDNDKC